MVDKFYNIQMALYTGNMTLTATVSEDSLFTDSSINSTKPRGTSHLEFMILVMDYTVAFIIAIGCIANVVTIIALGKHGQGFSPAILMLLRNQAIADALLCFMAVLLLMEPSMWVPGIYTWDLIVCHIWNGHALYWAAGGISVYNLVCLAYERYLAVCKPFVHQNLTTKKLFVITGLVYLTVLPSTVLCYFQVRYVDGKCLPKFIIDADWLTELFHFISNYWLFYIYVLPCLCFIFFYGFIISAFRKRKTENIGASRVIDKASSELTKTAFVVTIIFVITLSYDTWYYFLNTWNVVKYVKNDPVQKVGQGLVAVNSCTNPFVYGLLVPQYRASLKATFCGKKRGN